MARPARSEPTDAELAILRVLWEHGPLTVREVRDHLSDTRGTGYTTILKLMQIMFEKGLLRRDDSGHAHIYRAAVTRSRTQKKIITRVLDQVFDGSAQQLVLQALSARKSSPEELAEIRRMLDELQEDAE